MCGIIGYIGKENAVPIILDGLKRLEYRGYDSAGIAIMNENGFDVVKQKGRLSALEESIGRRPIEGFVGIGHTRWATHGEPSDINSHPHLGSQNKIAVVHNGIIENYRQIKERLEQKGVRFVSQTDSEVIAQLAEYYHDGDIVETVIKTANALEGSYALGIMCLDEPGKLVAIKKDNPLIVGISDHGSFIASDVPAVLAHTNRVCYLNDKEIAVLTGNSVEFYNMDGEPIQKQTETVTWSVDSAEKGGYEHFMLKEIMEQPRVLKETIRSALDEGDNRRIIDSLDITRFDRIVITACGSAYNAGMVAKYVFEKLCRMTVEVELASEFRYKDPIVDQRTLVILVSQSGETADTIAAMREARRRGATTVSIVNVVGSTIARETDYTLYTIAGPEIAVATTKAFSAQLVLLYMLAVSFAGRLGRITREEEDRLIADISSLPEKATEMLERIDHVQKYAAGCVGCKSIFFIGRNIDYAIALEGSLKLKEISYIHSEAYAGGELKHGTISLIEDNTLVVDIGNCIKAEPGEKLEIIGLPGINELFAPSLSVIYLQLFSYYVAANKGLDIDKPRNLAKSVTVE